MSVCVLYFFELWFVCIYVKEWDWWIIWYLYFWCSEEPPYCFP